MCYVEAQSLETYATLEDLLQVGQLHMIFSDQTLFYKLLLHFLALELDLYPTQL